MNILIDGNGTQMYQSPQARKTERTEPAAESTAADAEVQKSAIVSNSTDRVEISSQGRAALAQSAVVSAEETQAISPEQTAQIDQAQRLQAAKTGAQGTQAALGMAQEAAQADGSEMETAAEDLETSTDEAVIASASSTSSSSNLTTLTEEQLKSLVSDGTITQAEANTELARRAAAQQAAEANSAETDPAESEAAEKMDPVRQAEQAYAKFQQNESPAVLNAVA